MGTKLNEHVLLENLDDALQFREMTNRLPEHNPFHMRKLFRFTLDNASQ